MEELEETLEPVELEALESDVGPAPAAALIGFVCGHDQCLDPRQVFPRHPLPTLPNESFPLRRTYKKTPGGI